MLLASLLGPSGPKGSYCIKAFRVIYGPKELPKWWLHIPDIIMAYGTSNGPQDDIGSYLGPCNMVGFVRRLAKFGNLRAEMCRVSFVAFQL